MGEVIKPDELFNGLQGVVVAGEVELPAGEWKRGMLLGKVNGAYNLLGVTDYPAASVDCILADEITLAETGKAVAYFSGEFNSEKLIVDPSIAVSDVVDHARKLQIFIG
jgi:hypothetical protein